MGLDVAVKQPVAHPVRHPPQLHRRARWQRFGGDEPPTVVVVDRVARVGAPALDGIEGAVQVHRMQSGRSALMTRHVAAWPNGRICRSVYGQDRPLIASDAARPVGCSSPRNSVSTKIRSSGSSRPAAGSTMKAPASVGVHVAEPKAQCRARRAAQIEVGPGSPGHEPHLPQWRLARSRRRHRGRRAASSPHRCEAGRREWCCARSCGSRCPRAPGRAGLESGALCLPRRTSEQCGQGRCRPGLRAATARRPPRAATSERRLSEHRPVSGCRWQRPSPAPP